MNRIKSVCITIASAVFTYFVFYYSAKWFGSKEPGWISLALLASLFIHELCHALVMEWNGVKTNMVFLVIAAGVSPAASSRDIYQKFRNNTKALVYLAGVIGNLLIIVASMPLFAIGAITETHAIKLMNLNAALIFWNLLPLGIVDGGQLMRLIFEAIKESEEKLYVWSYCLMTGFTLAAIFIAAKSFSMLPIILFIWGIRRTAEKDDPGLAYSPKRLSKPQVFFWSAAWLSLMAISCAVELITRK